MNYFLTIIITLFSVYAQANTVTDKKQVKKWLKSNPLKKWGAWLAVGLCALSCYCLWQTECNAQRQHDEATKRIDGLQHSLDSTSNRLEYANAQIAKQVEMLSAQATTISEQSRTIGSIAYNTPTTFDGKMRFIRCFKDLSRLTDMKTEGTCFEGLICDDGVAMYWFDVEKDLLTGFHFFPNDELNRVLSGIPLDENLLDASGRLTIAADSELAIALNESLSRRTPSFSTEAPMNERADEAVVAELTTLFRYVYRALRSEFMVAYSKKTQKADGTRYLTFQYFVNPFAEQPHLRTVPNIELSASFMQSLYGATMIEFSQRVIAGCRRRGIEPKVNRTDLRRLNAVRMRDEIKVNSPFRQLHRKEY